MRLAERAITLSDSAIAELETLAQQVDAMEADARQIAADPAATPAMLQALGARLTPVATAYGTTRDTYVSLRAGVGAALDTVQRMDRLVRAVDIPDSLGTGLSAFDERITVIDAAFQGVVGAGGAVTAVSEGATALADQAANLSDVLRKAEDVGRAAQVGLGHLEAQLESAISTLDDLVALSVIALTVVLAWVFILNAALWALGRRWRAA
jgi:hypothetical protein